MKRTARIILLLAAGALAAGAAPYETADARFRQLERDIPTLYLMNGLYLTRDQNRRLAELLAEARDLDRRVEEEVAALERSRADALRPTMSPRQRPPNRAQVRATAERIRSLIDDKNTRLRGLCEKAYKLLTRSQLEIMDTFEPCFIPAPDFRNPARVGQAKGNPTLEDNVFRRLRQAPEPRLDEARTRALEVLVPYVMQETHMKYSEEAEADLRYELGRRLNKALPDIRELDDADYELEKTAIIQEVLQLEGPADGPGALNYDETVWKMSVFFLNPGCLDCVGERGGVKTAAQELPMDWGEHKKLRDAFQAARLLAALNLTEAQVADILPVVREGAMTRDRIEEQALHLKAEAVDSYEELRAELAAQSPTPETEGVCNGFHHRVKVIYDEDLVAALQPHEKQLDKALTADQVSLLLEDDPRDPRAQERVRTAPRKVRSEAVRLLERARRMSASDYAASRSTLASEFVYYCVAHSEEKSGINLRSQAAEAARVLDKARGLPRAEYARCKEDLAVEMCPQRSGERPTLYGHRYMHGEPLALLRRSSDLLFRQAAVRLLEEMAGP